MKDKEEHSGYVLTHSLLAYMCASFKQCYSYESINNLYMCSKKLVNIDMQTRFSDAPEIQFVRKYLNTTFFLDYKGTYSTVEKTCIHTTDFLSSYAYINLYWISDAVCKRIQILLIFSPTDYLLNTCNVSVIPPKFGYTPIIVAQDKARHEQQQHRKIKFNLGNRTRTVISLRY